MLCLVAFFRPGFWEILVVVAVVVLLFGTKALPKIADHVGKALRDFRRAAKEED